MQAVFWYLTKLPSRTEATTIIEVCNFLITPLVLLAVTLSILTVTTEDCDQPMRMWLEGLAIAATFSVGVSLLIIFTSCLLKEDADAMGTLGKVFFVCKVGLGFYSLGWTIVGSVWLFTSDGCSSDWPAGYIFSLILVVLGYILASVIVLLSCCLLIGSARIKLRASEDHKPTESGEHDSNPA
jgi:hypothetical protein